MKHLLTLSLLAILQMGWAQSEYCLDGTVWDAALGGCVPLPECSINSDLDGDGVVGVGDLLELLTEFGESAVDGDSDGFCDELDECVGQLDACGVCNGSGPDITIYGTVQTVYSDTLYTQNWYSYTCPQLSDCGLVVHQDYAYQTVMIGDQCWFAENLRSPNYSNGDEISYQLSAGDWSSATSGAIALYGDGDSFCESFSPLGDACYYDGWHFNEFGVLYNWYAVTDARGLCPNGWHVPTSEDWLVMANVLAEGQVDGGGIAGMMKTGFGWSNDGNGTNSSQFSGLPAGIRGEDGGFYGAGSVGFWWSSSLLSPEGFYLNSSTAAGLVNAGPTLGSTVRCIQDTE